jgi:hypothetical protein
MPHCGECGDSLLILADLVVVAFVFALPRQVPPADTRVDAPPVSSCIALLQVRAGTALE